MKKKVVSALLCATMVATMFVGCGGNNDSNTTTDTSKGETPAATEDTAEVADEGKVLNHLLLERGVQEPYHSSLSRLSGSRCYTW